jgi:protein-tyrosine phosphatase
MIDLHCHILPGVDDGAQTLEEALALCRLAAADGCTAMVATPHQRRGPWWNDDREHLRELADRLQGEMGEALTVRLGGEVHADPELLAEVERLPEGGILPLAGSRYLLIELDANTRPAEAIHLIHEIAVAGWYPILAHPEFIPWLAPDPELLRQLVGLGATAQVTAMSLTGDFGRRPQQDAWRMLDAGLVHFVASDSHDTRRRPPGLRRAHQMITARAGEETACRLTTDNPRAVLEDRPLPDISGDP